MPSATSATRVILPNAVTKSLHVNSRCSLLFTRLHPLVLESWAVISGSESFFAGMVHSSGSVDVPSSHYAAQLGLQQQFRLAGADHRPFERLERFYVECAREFHYRRGFFCSKKCA